VSAIGGSITVPLFQGGQLRARVEGQRAAADAALAAYESAVLRALEDVDNAMQAIVAAQEREQQLEVAQAAAERSVALARTRYQSGLIDFQSLLDAERSLLSTQESRLNARAARAGASVQLYKALGGGWPSPVA
jgi:outer membrane protein TolC